VFNFLMKITGLREDVDKLFNPIRNILMFSVLDANDVVVEEVKEVVVKEVKKRAKKEKQKFAEE